MLAIQVHAIALMVEGVVLTLNANQTAGTILFMEI